MVNGPNVEARLSIPGANSQWFPTYWPMKLLEQTIFVPFATALTVYTSAPLTPDCPRTNINIIICTDQTDISSTTSNVCGVRTTCTTWCTVAMVPPVNPSRRTGPSPLETCFSHFVPPGVHIGPLGWNHGAGIGLRTPRLHTISYFELLQSDEIHYSGRRGHYLTPVS